MRALTGNEVRQAVRGRWLSRNEPVPIRGVSIDSRTAVRDDLFVAVQGERFDGHDFLEAAAEKGCVGAIVSLENQPPQKIMDHFPAGVIGVPDTRAALVDLGGYYRSIIPATVVGVTGSNGKTTVKAMIHHILSSRLTGTSSPKSYNNEIGVPLTLLGAGAGDDYVVCEVGSSAPGEIARLARVVRPNITVITNVSEVHLERLESIDRIAVEKAALLGWLGERDIAVVSADSEELDQALKSYHQRRMIRFGESAAAQLRLTGYRQNGWTQEFQINERDWVSLPIPGRHNALNALAAIAVVARFGITQQDAAAGLADFQGVDMRLERMDVGGIHLINDAYNANPASVLAAARVLSANRAARRVLILGDMLELGDRSEELHAQLGRDIAAAGVDMLIAVGPQAAFAADSAAEAGRETAKFATITEAKKKIGSLLVDGDMVLIKGSRALGMEKLVAAIGKGKTKGGRGKGKRK
jgi:UDP-N-acetylmuramoyl-tripeptide--D-alanyl-D-alanine ligase